MTIAFVTQIESKTTGCGVAATTVPVTVYTVLATPTGPWQVADSPPVTRPPLYDPLTGVTTTFPPTYPDDLKQPWVSVLDLACTWVKGASTQKDAVAEITRDAYIEFGKTKTYNGFGSLSKSTHCNLSTLMSDWYNLVDCQDMSAVVQLFSQIVGVDGIQVVRVDGHSILGGPDGFKFKPIKAIGNSTWESGNWMFHQVVLYDGKIYSACEMLDQANPTQAVGMTWTEYKRLLYESGNWVEEAPFSITSFE